jgi:hypothetical protein
MLCTGRYYDFHCKICNNNMFFHCLCSSLMEKHDFLLFCHPLKLYLILYIKATIFFIALSSLEALAKTSESLNFHTYERERESTL